jgi:hypothetical protein
MSICYAWLHERVRSGVNDYAGRGGGGGRSSEDGKNPRECILRGGQRMDERVAQRLSNETNHWRLGLHM